MPRQLERRAVALVHDIYGGEIAATPDWLVRPGRNECLAAWPLIQGIYHQLTGQELPPDTMRPVERRTVDAVLALPWRRRTSPPAGLARRSFGSGPTGVGAAFDHNISPPDLDGIRWLMAISDGTEGG